MGVPWDGQPTASAKLVDLSLNCRGLFLLDEPDGTSAGGGFGLPQFGDGRNPSAAYLSASAAITDRLTMDPSPSCLSRSWQA